MASFDELASAIRSSARRGEPFRDGVLEFLRKRGLSATDYDILMFQRRLRVAFQAKRSLAGRASTSPEQEGEEDEDKMQFDTEAEREKISALLEQEGNLPAAKRTKMSFPGEEEQQRQQLQAMPQIRLQDLPLDMINLIAEDLSEGDIYRMGLLDKNKAMFDLASRKLSDVIPRANRQRWIRILSGDMALQGNVADEEKLLEYQLEDALAAYEILFPSHNTLDVIGPFIDWALEPFYRSSELKQKYPCTGHFTDRGDHGDRYDDNGVANVSNCIRLCAEWIRQPVITDANVVEETLRLFKMLHDPDVTDREIPKEVVRNVEFFFGDPRVSGILQRAVAHIMRSYFRYEMGILCASVALLYYYSEVDPVSGADPLQADYDANMADVETINVREESIATIEERYKLWYRLGRHLMSQVSLTDQQAVKSYDFLCQTFIEMVSDGVPILRLIPIEKLPFNHGGAFVRVGSDVTTLEFFQGVHDLRIGRYHELHEWHVASMCLTFATPFLRGERGNGKVYEFSYARRVSNLGALSDLAIDTKALNETQQDKIEQTLRELNVITSRAILLFEPKNITDYIPLIRPGDHAHFRSLRIPAGDV